MSAVQTAAMAGGLAEEAVHREYFSVPEVPERPREPFKLISRDGRRVKVAANQTAAEVLQAAGTHTHIKCGDGLCGVCGRGVVSGNLDHRDHVLSSKVRRGHMITCQSGAAKSDGEIVIDL